MNPRINSLIFFLAVVGLSTESLAQFPLSKTKSTLTGVRLNIGGFTDTYDNMNPDGMLSLIKSGQEFDFDVTQYERANSYSAAMSGGNIGVDLIFNPFKKNGNVRSNHEIRVGSSANLAREVMIDMTSDNTQIVDSYINGVTLCVIENEFLVQAAYLFKATIGRWKPIEVYAGPGVNVGGTFGNEFIFIGGPEQTLTARNSNYLRTHVIAGGSINVGKRMFLQAEGLMGIGTQIVHDGGVNFLSTSALQFSIGYRLKSL